MCRPPYRMRLSPAYCARRWAALSGYTQGEKCVLALEAGADLLLGVSDIPSAVTAVEQAVAEGRLSVERIDESVERVLNLKLEHGIA